MNFHPPVGYGAADHYVVEKGTIQTSDVGTDWSSSCLGHKSKLRVNAVRETAMVFVNSQDSGPPVPWELSPFES